MFQFKQFNIRQDRTPMKIGTDGVLLGAWVNIEKAKRILDIGTGTGLIALMAAQRNLIADIDAIEIEPNAYEQARENILASPWGKRINVIFTPVQQFYPAEQYDCILCNPPFFNQSTKTPHPGRTLARHTDTLPHTELIDQIIRLLHPNGHFAVILPPTEATAMIAYAMQHQLYPQRITKVLPNPDKLPKRYLMEFSFISDTIVESELITEISRHHYSPEYISLTKEFYLKME